MSYPGGRGRADYLELGSWNAVCFQCGRKRKADTLLRHWQGYYVCPAHWEPRQSQDFVRAINDTQTPPWTQPMPADIFTLGGKSGGFLIPGNEFTPPIFLPTPATVPDFTEITGTLTPEIVGASYVVGDVVGLGGDLTAIVTSIDGSGGVTGLTVDNPVGSPACSTQGGIDRVNINAHLTVSSDDLTATADSTVTGKNMRVVYFTSGSTDVYYAEATITSLGSVGVNIGLGDSGLTFSDNPLVALGSDTHGWAYASGNGYSYHNQHPSGTAYGASFTTGDVISIVYDTAAQTISFWKNGADQGVAFSSVTANLAVAAALNASSIITLGLAASSWLYTPPTGAIPWPTFSGIAATGGSGTGLTILCPTAATVNYASLDPAVKYSSLVLSPWNLVVYNSSTLSGGVLSTAFQATGVDRRLYCEFTLLGTMQGLNLGIATSSFPLSDSQYIGITSDSYSISPSLKWNNNSSATYGGAFTVGSVVGMLYDPAAGTLSFTINGTSWGVAFSGLSGTFCPAVSVDGGGIVVAVNYGSTPWIYAPPAGYNGWTV